MTIQAAIIIVIISFLQIGLALWQYLRIKDCEEKIRIQENSITELPVGEYHVKQASGDTFKLMVVDEPVIVDMNKGQSFDDYEVICKTGFNGNTVVMVILPESDGSVEIPVHRNSFRFLPDGVTPVRWVPFKDYKLYEDIMSGKKHFDTSDWKPSTKSLLKE